MSKLHVNVPHDLSDQEALERIKKMLSELKESQKGMVENLKEEWTGNTGKFSFTAKGFDLAGTIETKPGAVDINANLPLVLSMFKKTIVQVIKEKATALLS